MYSSSEPPASGRAFMAYRSSSPTGVAAAPLVPGHTRAWEDLRKEARKLEGELDVKLAAYAKLCSGFEANYRLKASDSSSLGADQLAQTKAAEIEGLLHRLSDVNDEMGGFMGGISDSRSHTLARHRDILQEFNQEFRRLNTTLGAARDRVQLLVGSGDAGHIGLNIAGSGTGALLRERATIQSSTNAVDEVLLQAQSVSTSLVDQRRVFDSIGDKVLQIGARFPVVNGLLNVIRRKKSKDTLVLSGVIAGCTLLIIIYLLAK
ncbi:Qb-SNARE, Gos1/GS28-family [Dunaliella salina]|uniref:Qb-SNARE, Gos1/GS28-family n=1 Tax=Dunaliella salina TaxID=3046 RepID=A0ABQ7GTI6_DUNSA|nr:Qb-SNARE, Gos1/GS28-family [Dunaliella salina]|eukprot:KAF5837898.1 Qb-SNARE, Gos1/GS28-family [Dunaliella salina]